MQPQNFNAVATYAVNSYVMLVQYQFTRARDAASSTHARMGLNLGHSGVVSLVSNFDDCEFIRVIIKVSTRSLYKGSYSTTQEWLYERVRTLRDEQKLTFNAIAEHLTKFGVKSSRGKTLGAEHVFSIYKKGNAYQARLTAEASVELLDFEFCVIGSLADSSP